MLSHTHLFTAHIHSHTRTHTTSGDKSSAPVHSRWVMIITYNLIVSECVRVCVSDIKNRTTMRGSYAATIAIYKICVPYSVHSHLLLMKKNSVASNNIINKNSKTATAKEKPQMEE